MDCWFIGLIGWMIYIILDVCVNFFVTRRNCLFDRLINRLIDVHERVDNLIDSFIVNDCHVIYCDWFWCDWLIACFVDWLIDWLIDEECHDSHVFNFKASVPDMIDLLIDLFIDWLIDWSLRNVMILLSLTLKPRILA